VNADPDAKPHHKPANSGGPGYNGEPEEEHRQKQPMSEDRAVDKETGVLIHVRESFSQD
jgi:hypothetical protein